MNCLNLCDIMNYGMTQEMICSFVNKYQATRIYVGSYFCEKYFLRMEWLENFISYCRHLEIKITLVIPVFSQKDLNFGKKKIDFILSKYGKNYIDEITVNDIGMLWYIKEKYMYISVNLGRLFVKDPRDIRIPQLYNSQRKIALTTIMNCKEYSNVGYIEADVISSSLTIDRDNIALHFPLCYMTTGKICKYASVSKEIVSKFRANAECNQECLDIIEKYQKEFNGFNFELYRIGRTIYFLIPEKPTIDGNIQRTIYFPYLELLEMRNGCK